MCITMKGQKTKMKMNRTKKIILSVLCIISLSLCMCLSILAEDDVMPIINADDGKITDNGNNQPLDPDAGTVADGTGDGIIGDASDAIGDFSQGVSDAASDMMGGMNGQGNVSDSSTGTQASTTGSGSAADGADNGGSIAAAIIICVIIAIAVIVLVIVLKKRD